MSREAKSAFWVPQGLSRGPDSSKMRPEALKKYSKSQVLEALPRSFRELPGVATQSPLGVRCSICGVFFPAGGQVSSFAFLVPDSSTGCSWDSERV